MQVPIAMCSYITAYVLADKVAWDKEGWLHHVHLLVEKKI